MADEGGLRIRSRYVGQTTAAALTVNEASNVAIRSIGTDWGGERLVDWTAGGANQRFYGTNYHHDVTFTADSTGAVSATLRYDVILCLRSSRRRADSGGLNRAGSVSTRWPSEAQWAREIR